MFFYKTTADCVGVWSKTSDSGPSLVISISVMSGTTNVLIAIPEIAQNTDLNCSSIFDLISWYGRKKVQALYDSSLI